MKKTILNLVIASLGMSTTAIATTSIKNSAIEEVVTVPSEYNSADIQVQTPKEVIGNAVNQVIDNVKDKAQETIQNVVNTTVVPEQGIVSQNQQIVPKKEIEFKELSDVVGKVDKDIQNSTLDTVLDRQAQAEALLNLERLKTQLLQERANQLAVVENENKIIAEREGLIKSANGEEVQNENGATNESDVNGQNLPFNQVPETPIVVADTINVLSVYGTENNLFAEIKVNNVKYQVKNGQKFGDGYVVKGVNRDGVKLSRNGEEPQFISVAPPDTNNFAPIGSLGQQIPQSGNVIAPFQLR